MSAILRAKNRAEHLVLFEHVRHEIKLGTNGRLHRLTRSLRAAAPEKPIQPKGQRTTRWVMLAGRKAYAHEIAHVLRVGPQGPLIAPGYWQPKDGDWLNVSPDNWAIDRRAPAEVAREASLRARRAAAASRLVPDALRPGTSLVPMTEARQRATYADARYWWARLSGAHGEASRELSAVWDHARTHATRWWALSHHLARFAAERLAALPSGQDKAAYLEHVRVMIRDADAESLRVIRDTGRWARVAAEMDALSIAGDITDTPEHAAAVHASSTTDATADDSTAGLY